MLIVARLLLVSTSFALQASEVELSTGVKFFDRKEFNADGSTSNHETGPLTGVELRVLENSNQYEHRFSLEVWSGAADYDGQTQSGTPLNTHTDETLGALGYALVMDTGVEATSFYISAQWDIWRRNIRPTATTLRLEENYRWLTLGAGIKLMLPIDESSGLQLETGIIYTVSGTVRADLRSSNLGEPEITLANGIGVHLGATCHWSLANDRKLLFAVIYEHLRQDSSNPVQIGQSQLTELASLSQPLTLTLSYRLGF